MAGHMVGGAAIKVPTSSLSPPDPVLRKAWARGSSLLRSMADSVRLKLAPCRFSPLHPAPGTCAQEIERPPPLLSRRSPRCHARARAGDGGNPWPHAWHGYN